MGEGSSERSFPEPLAKGGAFVGVDGPCGIAKRAKVWLLAVKRGAVRMNFKRISIDTSKSVFTLHGIDEHDRAVLRRDLGRAAMERFLAKLEPTEIALEACGGSHHWGRRLTATWATGVRLLPPAIRQAIRQTRQERPPRCRGVISEGRGAALGWRVQADQIGGEPGGGAGDRQRVIYWCASARRPLIALARACRGIWCCCGEGHGAGGRVDGAAVLSAEAGVPEAGAADAVRARRSGGASG